MHSVINPRPVAKINSLPVGATVGRSIIRVEKSSYPPRVTLGTTIITGASKKDIVSTKMSNSNISLTSRHGLSQNAINTALCDDTSALCDDTIILAGQYIDYSEQPTSILKNQLSTILVSSTKIIGVVHG